MKKHALCALGAACLWGLIGLFTRNLSALGFASGDTLIVRCAVAAALFGLLLLVRERKGFRIRLRDLWCFLGSGICSLLFFTFCYFQAIERMEMSVAAILLYTAPIFVMLMSAVVFRERITARKGLALAVAFAGCCLVSGGGGKLTGAGLLYGLGAGFGYALYSIFARLALDRGYSSTTVNFYSCLFSCVGACLIWGLHPFALAASSWQAAGLSVGIGVVCCFLPYLLYTYALTGCEPSRASILCTAEPVVAAVMGVAAFGEPMTPGIAAGMALTIGAIALLNLPARRKETAHG